MAIGENLDLSQVLEKMSRLGSGPRYLILFAVFVAVAAVYGFTLYRSTNKQVVALDTNLAELHSQIAEGRAVASNLKSFEEEQQRLKAELEAALGQLPNEKELPVLLTDLTSLGKKSGLEIRSFRPGQEINRGFYAEVPINIEFRGRYHEAGMFFDRLSRLSRIVNVTELEMDLADSSAALPLLKVRGIATTFRFVEEKLAPGGGA